MKKTVSVVIVSYKNAEVIENCLLSIRKHNDLGNELEVIVVEQSPEDTLFQDLTGRFPDMTILRAENRGFGAGNNIGAKQATGEILFFLNPDTVVEEPVFAFVLRQFRENPRLGLMGVRLVNGAGEDISVNMRFPYGIMAKAAYVLLRKLGCFTGRLMYIEGADLIIRREVFEQIGGFDEHIFMYGEEMDLCWRIREAGREIRFFPQKTIRHLQGKSTDGCYPQVFSRQLDSFSYVCRKHGASPKPWLRRELRCQRVMKAVFTALGKADRARLAGELQQVLKEKLASA